MSAEDFVLVYLYGYFVWLRVESVEGQLVIMPENRLRDIAGSYLSSLIVYIGRITG